MHDITHIKLWRAIAGYTIAWLVFSALLALLKPGLWWPAAAHMVKFSFVPFIVVAASADPLRWLRLWSRRRRRRLDIDTPIGALGPFDRYDELTLGQDFALNLKRGGFTLNSQAFDVPPGSVLHLKTDATVGDDGSPEFVLTLHLKDLQGNPLPRLPWSPKEPTAPFQASMHSDKEPALYWAAWTACQKAGITLKTPRGTFTPEQMRLNAEDRLRAQLGWLSGARLDGTDDDSAAPHSNTSAHDNSAPLCRRDNRRETLYVVADGTTPELRLKASQPATSAQPGDTDATLHKPRPRPHSDDAQNLTQLTARARLKAEFDGVRVFAMCSLIGVVTAPLALYVLLQFSKRPRHARALKITPRWMRVDRSLHALSSLRMVSAFPVHEGPVMMMTDTSAFIISGLSAYEDRVAWGRHFIKTVLRQMDVPSTADLDPSEPAKDEDNDASQSTPRVTPLQRGLEFVRLSINIIAPSRWQGFLAVLTLSLMAYVCSSQIGWLQPWWLFHRVGMDYEISLLGEPLCLMFMGSLLLTFISMFLGMSGRFSMLNSLQISGCTAAAFALAGLWLTPPEKLYIPVAYSSPSMSAPLHISQLKTLGDGDINLEGTDLSFIDFHEAFGQGLMMGDTNLNGVRGRYARFDDAYLSGARMADAHMHQASFQRASMIRVIAPRAIFQESTLDGATLTMGRFNHGVFTDASAKGTNFDHAALRHAELTQFNAEGATFMQADLSKANLSRAILKGADMRILRAPGANFTAADLRNAILSGADLSAANFTGADLSGAVLVNARFPGAIMEGVTLSPDTRCPDGELAGSEPHCDF